MIITIDGPAGSGKSSLAKAIATRHNLLLLRTGEMYRAVAWYGLRGKIDLKDETEVAALTQQLKFSSQEGVLLCQGEQLSEEIHSPEVSREASNVALFRTVRNHLVAQQRKIAESQPLITEGRDQGTVVFPHADCKLFLTASVEERARRRFRQLSQEDQTLSNPVDFDFILQEMKLRDLQDQERELAPLKPAEDAIIIDTTQLSFQETLEQIDSLIHSL